MGMFDKARETAEKFAKDNPDKVTEAIQRVGDEVDKRTGGKFTEQIDQAEEAVTKQLGADQQPDQQQG